MYTSLYEKTELIITKVQIMLQGKWEARWCPWLRINNDQNQYSFIILFLINNCLLCSIYWHSFELENRFTDFYEQHVNFDESMIYYMFFDLEWLSAWTETFINRHESDKIGVYNILWLDYPTDIEFIKKKNMIIEERKCC